MSKTLRDDTDRFFQYNVDIGSRTIYMGSMTDNEGDESGVDYLMAESVIKALHILDSQAETGDRPITIIMNNPGGDYNHGMAIFDAIKCCKNHITIKVYGYSMSMGAVILQAADERLLAPHSRLMIHYGYSGSDNTSKNFLSAAEEEKKLNKQMEDILLEKIKEKKPHFTRAKLKQMLDPDTFLSPKEAIDLGLADGELGDE